MIHVSASGQRVAVAVLIRTLSAQVENSVAGQEVDNLFLRDILPSLLDPAASSTGGYTRALQVDPYQRMMPGSGAYFHYTGSLTTPPCTEGVEWVIMKENVYASEAQISAMFNATGTYNHRPVQVLLCTFILVLLYTTLIYTIGTPFITVMSAFAAFEWSHCVILGPGDGADAHSR